MNVINTEGIARDVVVIGASTGGIAAVAQVLRALPSDLPAIIGLVIHRSATSLTDWSQAFQAMTRLRVTEPSDGERLVRGSVYVAPADHHMRFSDGCAHLDRGPKQAFARPSADILFGSAAAEYTQRVVGVVLTGNGTDGAEGCLAVFDRGGISIVQRPDEAAAASMPIQAIARDHIHGELSIDDIASALSAMVHGRSAQVLSVGGSQPNA